MVQVTRLDYRIERHGHFDEDGAILYARYCVEGREDRLEISMVLGTLTDDMEKLVEVFLKWCDEEAQWAADNPEQVKTLKPELVIVD
jgi:hypothetical protein